jgi:hypothetical protein
MMMIAWNCGFLGEVGYEKFGQLKEVKRCSPRRIKDVGLYGCVSNEYSKERPMAYEAGLRCGQDRRSQILSDRSAFPGAVAAPVLM